MLYEVITGNSTGALDVVIEGRDLVAVTIEDRQGITLAEILPLDHDVREYGFRGLDEFVHDGEIVSYNFV